MSSRGSIATTGTKTKRAVFRCRDCAYESAKWLGRCPNCSAWGSLDEGAPARRAGNSSTSTALAEPISRVNPAAARATATGVGEFDRVLGRGLVAGSVVLVAGEPGVGKSTLLLAIAHNWAKHGTALYVTGEESAGQVRLRADRTDSVSDNLYLAATSDLADVVSFIEDLKPGLVIVDSVQTMIAADADGVVGGVTQVKAVASTLTAIAKSSGVAIILVGHVTKEGALAGPRTLEHLVDVVLSFDGDRNSTLRMIRGVKNRFGAADEVGCFEMHDRGIEEVPDPSRLFLHHRNEPAPGTAITVSVDGKRALVGEVQALVTQSHGGSPRRAVSGLDTNRLSMVLAVLASVGFDKLVSQEVYASTVGGMQVREPAADLAIALAIASSSSGHHLPARMVALGEVGLASEIRMVSGIGKRLSEAFRLGFTRAYVPKDTPTSEIPTGMSVTRVADLASAIQSLKAVK